MNIVTMVVCMTELCGTGTAVATEEGGRKLPVGLGRRLLVASSDSPSLELGAKTNWPCRSALACPAALAEHGVR